MKTISIIDKVFRCLLALPFFVLALITGYICTLLVNDVMTDIGAPKL
jgi:hypothetical protein